MHAAATIKGVRFKWAKYFEPTDEEMAAFYSANDIGDGWDILEPAKP